MRILTSRNVKEDWLSKYLDTSDIRAASDRETDARRKEAAGRTAEGTSDPKIVKGVGSVQWGGDDKVADFVQIAEHSRPQLLWLAQRITQDWTEAEDIVQEALLRAFKYLPRFRGESQMSTWLGVIVKNTGREWLRQRKGLVYISLEYTRDSDDDPILRDFPDPGRDPEQRCAQKELSDILHTEIDGLHGACKSTMKMCGLDESSQLEAANALGVSITSVKSRMFRGKRMLKRAFCRRTGGEMNSFSHSGKRIKPRCSMGMFKLYQ